MVKDNDIKKYEGLIKNIFNPYGKFNGNELKYVLEYLDSENPENDSNPWSEDTDSDCILDGNEILWAATLTNVSATDAIQLVDADGDGENDSITFGCIPTVVDNSDNNSNNNTTDDDSDGDGILDLFDDCPNTEVGVATDTQGCSNEQNKEQTSNQAGEEESSTGLNFMLWLVGAGVITLIGATIILFIRTKPEEGDIQFEELSEVKNFDMPILDGTTPEPIVASGPNMSRFPEWDLEQVQNYLDSGWTEDQLADWYQQQIDDNSTQG